MCAFIIGLRGHNFFGLNISSQEYKLAVNFNKPVIAFADYVIVWHENSLITALSGRLV
jgi:hypothetical protein